MGNLRLAVLFLELTGEHVLPHWHFYTEMKDIIDFVNYEKANGRDCEITADRQDILDYVREEMRSPDKYRDVRRPEVIRECTVCSIGSVK